MEFRNEQTFIKVDRKRVAAALAAAAGETDPPIGVTIVDDDTIHELNRRHLDHDYPTDVISFDYGDGEDAIDEAAIDEADDDVRGEVIASAETARRVAESLGRDPEEELLLYIVHGTLHLSGFDDTTDETAARMRAREKEVCAALGLADPWEAGDAAAGATSADGSGGPVLAFTDGACRGNPGPGGYGVRILYPDGRILEEGGAARQTTNNRMELSGVIAAIELTTREAAVEIVTDSEYVRLGITQWMKGWKKRGWKTIKGEPVKNRDLWEKLGGILGPQVSWRYVAGHTGDPDNERCDRIAVAFAEGQTPFLADGSMEEGSSAYADALVRRSAPAAPRRKKSSGRKGGGGAAKYYLSLVNGVVCRHATWPECEARVKGVSGARFKKCSGESEERSILAGWGVGPESVA